MVNLIVVACLLALLPRSVTAVEFRAREFGALGDGTHDDGPALRRMFAAASAASEPSLIRFEAGRSYYLAPHDEANGRLLLREAAHVTIDGQGAILVVHPHNRAFGVYRSHDIAVRNLQIDYRPLPFIQGTITGIDNAGSWLEFEPHPGYADPVEGDDSLYRDGRNEDSVTLNRESRRFYHAHSRISRVAKVGPGRFRITYRGRRFTEARVGDFFAMKTRWESRQGLRYTGTDNPVRRDEFVSTPDPSISLAYSDGVLLENVRSLAAPGMTLNVRGGSGLVVRGLVIERTGDRLVAGNSDGIHVKCGAAQPLIQDCRIEGTMDDSIHVKISGDWIMEVASPRRVRIQHMDIMHDNTNLATGRRVMVYDHGGKRAVASATIADYAPLDHRSGWATLDRDVPGIAVRQSLYLEAEGEAVIERCTFGTQLQRAILTHQPTVIRGCVITHNGQGIVVAFQSIEGPPSQRLRVEGCRFSDLTRGAISVACPSPDYDQKGDPQFICVGNTFRLPPGVPAIQVTHSRGVALRENTFYGDARAPAATEVIKLTGSPLREDRGNRFLRAGER